tara:strand:+ start:602 stop:1351 length:750 start_codon:yes stop_codon:yes gene_type:complete
MAGRRAFCKDGHSFDQAKEGYFNLLLANQKGSLDPGDDRESVNARRDFLSAGHYDFLSDGIRPYISSDATLLDAGCGEGHFLNAIAPGPSYGIDISRSAIRLAAHSNRDHTWCVANLARRIPLADHSCTTIVSILSPRNNDEFRRILRPDGLLICVIPGPNHLTELTSRLMANPSNAESKPSSLLHDLPAFRLLEQESVTREFPADHSAIQNLIAMTPLRWKSRRQSLAEVDSLSNLDITADVTLLTFR